VLPISLTPKTSDKPIRLKGTVDIGVCKDICVPLQIMVDETIKANSTAATQAIKTALATVPRAGARHVSCDTTLGTRGIQLTVAASLPHLGGAEDAAIETGDPLVWATDPEVSRRGQTLTLKTELIHALSGTFALNRSALRLTLIGTDNAIDIQGCD
jgi:DsbC/DsbD-like thiol-disulfide interchange protein